MLKTMDLPFLWSLPVFLGLFAPSLARNYTAAVYEHCMVLNPQPERPVSRQEALEHMRRNLVVYEEQAGAAAKQGAQIIVFPEDGIHGFNYTRESIGSYLETVPDPANVTWNPCTEPDRFPNTEVLRNLSCIAKKHKLYLVANMPDKQICQTTKDPHCPHDGRYQFNTDVAFADDGALVARYHKQNLYFEASFDEPATPELVTFHTPFAGTFGVFTCFDILFYEPALRLVEELGVRQLIFPTAWMNQLPLLASVQFQRAFAYATGATLLAANLRSDSMGMTGSGIFTQQEEIYHYNTGDETGRLLVATIPALGYNGERKDGDFVPFKGKVEGQFCHKGAAQCSEEPSAARTSTFNQVHFSQPKTFYGEMMYDNFTFALLEGTEGNMTVCDGALCCHLSFQRSGPQGELYALGAFDGLHRVDGTYYLQICALVRCKNSSPASCGAETESAHTQVNFHLVGDFSTRHVFPSVLGSGVQPERPNQYGWDKEGRVFMSREGMKNGLVAAALYGRWYSKDRHTNIDKTN